MRRLSPAAASFAGVAVAVAVVAAAVSFIAIPAPSGRDWLSFGLLLPLAIAAPFFTVSIGRNHGFHTGPAFIVAGALVLPPSLLVALVLALHIPAGVIRDRYPWYIQLFNIANYTLSALAGWAAADTIGMGADARLALAGLAAAAAFVVVNHLLLATMLRLGRGHSFRDTGLFSAASLATELALSLLGVGVGAFALFNPWLVPALVAPLLLAHRSLSTLALLRESEERFRTMFESAPTAMMLLGVDGSVLATNRSLKGLLGYSEEELRRLPLGEHVHPDDREEGAKLYAEVVKGERDGYRREARFLTKEGQTVVTHLAAALVRDADGKPNYVIGMAEDVTDNRVLEEQLRQSQKLEAIGRLAGGVAHDFNNMLTAIGGYTALALDQADEGSPLRADLDEVRKATDRATLLTRQLLAFSRKQVLEPVILDLNDVIRDLSTMLRPVLGADLDLVLDLDERLGPVEADPSQLNQVVMNLVVNARDSMPAGGALTITTENMDVDETGDGAIEPGRYVALTVRDGGEGMDEETLGQIFEPFFTTKVAGKGTGLGLATVYGIVKQSGGYLEVESEVGAGSAFRIYLRRVVDARPPTVVDEPVSVSLAAVGEPATVLVVEDEAVVRGLVTQVLERESYRVLVAHDGEEALAHAGSTHVDVLLTDLTMPTLGGRELAERLRAANPELKVVFMSGYADSGILSSGVLPPRTAFLSKPFTFAELAGSVRGLL